MVKILWPSSPDDDPDLIFMHVQSVFGPWNSCCLPGETDKDKEVSEHGGSLQVEGVDSSFDMQMGWFETCSQAAINLFESFGHTPRLGNKGHSNGNLDNDRCKEALMNFSHQKH